MPNIKTAISIKEPLFKEVDALAHQLDVSRSQLFVMAVEKFIRQYRNQQLLEQINQAYADEADPAEQNRLAKMKFQYRRILEGQW